MGTLLLTLVATLLNPFGVDVWRYALDIAGNRQISARISEWQPPRLTDAQGVIYGVSVVAVVIAVAAIGRRRRGVPWPTIVALLAFAGLGAMAARGVAWWPAIAVVSIASLLGDPGVVSGGRRGEAAAPAAP